MDTTQISEAPLQPLDLDSPRKWKRWLLFFLLALALHLFFFRVGFKWDLPQTTPPPVEVQNISPQQLNKIKQRWKDKPLVIDKDKSLPTAKEPAPDAKFMSDRNIRVEKEQRARNTQVVVKPGAPVPTPPQKTESKPQSKSKPYSATKPLPSLSSLGLAFNLTSSEPPKKQEEEQRQAMPAAPLGGEQYIDDPSLAEGNQNLLNTQESVYYGFYARIYEAIGPVWESMVGSTVYSKRPHPGSYDTVVDVVLDASGNVIALNRLQSSGNGDIDQVAETAFRKIGRFQNPPKGLLNAQNQVHLGWRFRVQIGEGAAFRYMPPQRAY